MGSSYQQENNRVCLVCVNFKVGEGYCPIITFFKKNKKSLVKLRNISQFQCYQGVVNNVRFHELFEVLKLHGHIFQNLVLYFI